MKKAVLVLGIIFFLIFPATVYSKTTNGYTLTTNDNLQLTLDENGVITSIQINNNELVNNPSPALWIRDYTPNYSIQNLIINPGFENDENHDGIADGWTPYTFNGEPDISLDASHAHSGNTSLRMFSPAASNQNQMAYISTPVEIQENTEYCLTLHAMNDFGFLEDWWTLSMSVYCIFYNSQSENIGQEELQIHHTMNTWKQFSKIIVSPANTVEAEIWIVFNGPKSMTVPGAEESTAWFDDICLYEMPDETKMKPIEGALHQENNNLIFEGNSNNLQFTLDYTSQGDYIEINGNIENTYNREKAFDVYFLLPVNAHDWTWWDDIRNQREIENGLYEMVINADESSYLPLSPYPLSAVTKQNLGLSLAIPLSKPRIFRIFYNAESNKYGISFSFGLSPMTQFNTINFTVYLYKCDADWGFRDALDRYYNFFPEYFDKSIDSEFMNASGEFADFGIRFIQGSFHGEGNAKFLQELNENHIYACEYTLPSAFEPKSLESINEPSPNYEGFLDLIDYYAENGYFSLKMKAKGAENSTVCDVNSDAILAQILRGPNWAPDNWVGRFPLNADPDLPGFNIADVMMETLIQPAFDNAEKYNAILNGVELDNFMKISRHIDMDQSRFQYTDFPLTYSPNNFKPGIHVMNSMVEYLRYLSNWLSENYPHAKITGNCVERGVASFGFPYLAALPFEMGSLKDWNFNDVELNYRRSMAYHRLVMAFQCNKMYDELGRVILPDVYDFINESIFYGIYPIMKDDFFENCNYERVRGLYQKIIPIVDELHLAGWDPLTYAHVNDEKIFVERFGNNSSIYVTVRNNDSTGKNYALTIDTEKLGIENDVSIMEMFTNVNVSYEYDTNGDILIYDSIDSRGTKIFKISNVSMLNIQLTKPKGCWLYFFNKPVIPIGNTIIIGRITIETSVYSSEGLNKVEFYVNNKLKHVDEDLPYQWTWDEFAFGKYEIKVVASDAEGRTASDEIMVLRVA